MHLKPYKFRVPVYKGVPLPWMKGNTSFNDQCWPSGLVWKVSLFEKSALNNTTLWCPFLKRFSSHGWSETHHLTMSIRGSHAMDEVTLVICRWLQVISTSLNSFTFTKVHLKQHNFRVPVYKGVPIQWMKWNSSFNDECRVTILVKKLHFLKSERYTIHL